MSEQNVQTINETVAKSIDFHKKTIQSHNNSAYQTIAYQPIISKVMATYVVKSELAKIAIEDGMNLVRKNHCYESNEVQAAILSAYVISSTSYND
jgi:hypothetical protein